MDCYIADDARTVAVTVAKEVNKTPANRRLAILANKRTDTSVQVELSETLTLMGLEDAQTSPFAKYCGRTG
jgi:hypothetical protein